MQRFTKEEKLWAVDQRLNKKRSFNSIADQLSVHKCTVMKWVNQFSTYGTTAFDRKHNTHYSEELKNEAVRFYLDGRGSMSDRQLRSWIRQYNSHELKASPGIYGGTKSMTKGRKTTFDERVSIVEECIKNNMNYAETAEKYGLSYQQVYVWLRKYKQKGIEGLKDHRGRRKPESEMSDLEKLKAENRMLKAELERKELENMFLKKVDEIERRRS